LRAPPLLPHYGIADFARVEYKIKSHLTGKLSGLGLESISVVDGAVNLQCQYEKRSTFDRPVFSN